MSRLTPRALGALLLLLTAPAPAGAQSAPPPAAASPEAAAPEAGDKLPAQLPSVTVRGQDPASASGTDGRKLLPGGPVGPRVRLPEPLTRRATAEGNRALMVNVTPSTLETGPTLLATEMPFSSILGGYGPITQYRAGLYDARFWGPMLGITQVDGRAGWGWSDWAAKEWLDWRGLARLQAEGGGFGWQAGSLQGGQAFFHGAVEHGASEDFLVGLVGDQGQLANGPASALGAPSFVASTLGAYAHARLAPAGEHRLGLRVLAQGRRWATQAGPEGYAAIEDSWLLSDAVQLESSLGAGYYGFEPVVDPDLAFHYRPDTATHFLLRLRTASELPDFQALYFHRPAVSANAALQAERIEGWAELAATRRLNEAWWASAGADLKRSQRHIFWQADPAAAGLWHPLNAPDVQWLPGANGRLAYQWLPNLTQDLSYGYDAALPLGFGEQRLASTLTGSLLDQRLSLALGLEGRLVTLSGLQTPGGGTGQGVFAEAAIEFALTRELHVGLQAADVPLSLSQPAANYFVPTPILTATARYQF